MPVKSMDATEKLVSTQCLTCKYLVKPIGDVLTLKYVANYSKCEANDTYISLLPALKQGQTTCAERASLLEDIDISKLHSCVDCKNLISNSLSGEHRCKIPSEVSTEILVKGLRSLKLSDLPLCKNKRSSQADSICNNFEKKPEKSYLSRLIDRLKIKLK